ncbi:MAG: CoA transferase [Actinobacteria bacterium]|nr:MAG: CoA transferase [Actinomycetota bacterium]
MSSKLAGVRVIDAGTRIAAPFCAGLLGEQGAEVVKVEQPREGDFLRVLGPFVHDDYSLFWAVEGRGRKSVTCDLRQPEGQELFRRLCAHADVLVENFRPGTLEHWNVGPADLDPRLVIVRCTIFGQDGPYAARPGLDRIGMSYGGVMYLTGYADRPPVRTGVTIADYLTGVFAAQAAVAALYDRDARGSGKGSVIDVAQYEAVLRTLEWTIPGYELTGEIRERSGNRLAHAAPMDNFVASDGKYVCITAGAEANFERLCKAMGRPELADDPRFATPGDRAEHGDEINDIVSEWVMGQTTDEAVSACVKSGVPVAPILSVAELVVDEHLVARGALVEIDDPIAGPHHQQAPLPRFDGEAPVAPTAAPRLGEHNEDVWCGLVGLSTDELADYQSSGVI